MEQFIECKCLKTKKGLIPFWNLDVTYDKEDDCIKYLDPDTLSWVEYYDKKNSIIAAYDLLNKTVIGEKKVIKVFMSNGLNRLNVGDKVLIEDNFCLKELKFVEISEISMGNLETTEYLTEEEFKSMGYSEVIEEKEISELGNLIKVEVYRRKYTFSNGESTEYTYNIYRLKE